MCVFPQPEEINSVSMEQRGFCWTCDIRQGKMSGKLKVTGSMKAIEIKVLTKRYGQAHSVKEGEIFDYRYPIGIRMVP